MKTAIITDSSCYFKKEYLVENEVKTVPLTVNFDFISYKEGVEDDETTKEIFDKIKELKVIPTTSQPTGDEFIKVFTALKKIGYERILVFTITSNLSGTFQGACAMANMFMEENADVKVEVYDSKNVAMSACFPIIDIINRKKVGGDLSSDKINEIIDFYAENAVIYLVVNSLDFLSYGGRISSNIAAIGNLFGIKPLLRIKGGVFEEQSKCRSRKKAFQEIVELYKREVTGCEGDYYLTGAHTLALKEVSKLVKVVESSTDKQVDIIDPIGLGPVVSIHVGPETVGIAWSKKYIDQVN